MYLTSKNFKKNCKIKFTLENGKEITLNICPKFDKWEGRDIQLNEISIDAPKEVKFTVEKNTKGEK